ncbi:MULTISPECIES: phage integrase [Methylomicrobium]|uniref:Site-specific recombinase XerD n=1 Tax=Methylomicrobium album BG8 TaxID=686340 RepID=H8GHF8_METAL|nr:MULTISPECIES: tyrosine-type recombinase/integrase [Methylomicrobium]EIC30110.1 site-specific recombinase XerD [Methylomicrobium album BG8]
MIKKQGDKWLVDIQPGGRGHRRFRKTFDTKAEARRYQITIESKAAFDPAFSLPKKDLRKLSEFVELWWENTGQHLSSGLDTKQRMIQASSAMGNPIMATFQPCIFLEYRSKRANEGVKAATLNRELQTFKAVFNDLSRSMQFQGKNHFNAIRLIKCQDSETIFLTIEQIKKLFSYLARSESDAYLIALVCLSTGARWGEAQGLRLMDLANGMVHYRRTKSKRARSVPVTNDLYQKLQDRLQQGPFNDAYSTFTRRLYESGIKLPEGQRTHVLRHTFASHYMMNGGNILALQKILGHSSLNVTMKYAHLAPDYLREILEINPALSIR